MPQSGQDVPDDLDARLVVLRSRPPLQQGAGQRRPRPPPRRSSSRAATRPASIATRSSSSRRTRPACRTSTRRRASYLAWESILAEKVTLNLDPQQVKQAETQKTAADSTVTARLPETYQWLLVPVQTIAAGSGRVAGVPALGTGCSRRAREQEAARATNCLLTGFAGYAAADGARPGAPLARQPRRDQAARRGLRALSVSASSQGPVGAASVAIRDGLGLLTWSKDSFAFADSFDELAGRYRGLRGGQMVAMSLRRNRPACWSNQK